MKHVNTRYYRLGLSLIVLFVIAFAARCAWADVFINVLAVNGTEEPKEKEIRALLPPDVKSGDVLDTAGLSLDYDVEQEAYYVYGSISLGPKESKTFKVRVRDIWRVEENTVNEIKKHINDSFQRMEGTEYFETAKIKKASLEQRLDHILTAQSQTEDNISQRIDRFRIYQDELNKIRNNSISVPYWRSKPPTPEEARVITFVIEMTNTSKENVKTVEQRHYLPAEVKPEHLQNIEGFTIGYDPLKGQPFLEREEEIGPGQTKSYRVGIIDVWNVKQQEIDNLKDRTREAWQYLKETEYKDAAEFLVKNIDKNLEDVEASQAQDRDIKGHISAYRENIARYNVARKDVEAIEDLLNIVRENLERSRLRNVLERIRSLRSLSAIAEAILGIKPTVNNAWRIITGIVIFVGILTLAHFVIWGRRSKDKPIKGPEEESEENKKE